MRNLAHFYVEYVCIHVNVEYYLRSNLKREIYSRLQAHKI